MKQSIGLVSLVVREYEEALAFYVGVLGFTLSEDSLVPEQNKRWVVVAPPGASETRLLLARASTEEQATHIGNQTGGRVFLFLYTDDFVRDYDNYRSKGVVFVREPKREPYGTVAVFRDLYGNLWDLIEPSVPEPLEVRLDDLSGAPVRALLEEHLRSMEAISPRESVHALDIDRLRQPDVTFWTVWANGELLGCGALRELSAQHGEVKSMRTAVAHRGRGVARAVLEHIVREAERRSYQRLSLETGPMAEFAPARKLYESSGFTYCPPFGDYVADPNSVFMTRSLGAGD